MSGWLVAASAYVRLGASVDAAAWVDRIQRAEVHIAAATLLEIGRATRNAADWTASLDAPPLALMPVERVTAAVEDRALEVQGILARRGLHRGPSPGDLLSAATAELAARTLVHHDRGFDLIAQLTGQPMQRLRLS